MQLKIITKSGHVPHYETEESAGMDVRAFLKGSAVVLEPGKRALIPTGLFLELEKGYEAQIRARSGLAVKYGIGLVNGVGTIDSDYRGEVQIPLINWGEEPFTIRDGDRIAQMIISRFERISWIQVCREEELSKTERGSGGFGHTGEK